MRERRSIDTFDNAMDAVIKPPLPVVSGCMKVVSVLRRLSNTAWNVVTPGQFGLDQPHYICCSMQNFNEYSRSIIVTMRIEKI